MRKKSKTWKTTLPTEVAEVAELLRVWRETREAGPRIPEELWRRAGELARRHGVSRISSALRLHYYDLRRHTRGRHLLLATRMCIRLIGNLSSLTGSKMKGNVLFYVPIFIAFTDVMKR